MRDADGTVLAEGEETGYHGMDFFDTTIPADGEYQLVVTSFGANETFEYSLDLNCRDRAPVLKDPPESVPIAGGETIETDFVEGDRDRPLTVTHDVYCFQGTAGDVVTITTLTDEMGVTPMLYDPDGHQDPPSRDPETDEYDPPGNRGPPRRRHADIGVRTAEDRHVHDLDRSQRLVRLPVQPLARVRFGGVTADAASSKSHSGRI